MPTTNPHELADLFLRNRKGEKAKATVYKNSDHLGQFTDWLDQRGTDSLRDLDGEDLLRYKLHLQDDPNKADTTISNHFSTLRTFFRFCYQIDALEDGQELHKKLEAPDFDKSLWSRDDMYPVDLVKKRLDYFDKYDYASQNHVIFAILWHTGCRRGALRSLDLDDYSPVKEREHGRYGLMDFHHRKETETTLKNKSPGERQVMIWPQYGEIIEDFIDGKRRSKVDEYGRKPLIPSPHGRYSVSHIQQLVNSITRPCEFGEECPHNRDPETCEARYYDTAQKCPSSVSPHPLRRSSITYHLEEKNWTYEAASGRFDVSVPVLEEHYDESTSEGQRKTRAAHFYDGDQATL